MLGGLIMDFGGVLTDPGDGDGDSGDSGGDGDRAECPLVTAVAFARRHGLRTALLSNTDGLESTTDTTLFDAVILSGEVGFGKPDVRIYLLAAKRIGLPPEQCVFVDDIASNVHGAVRAGMVGVHHHDVAATLAELTALFGLDFH
ncbi:MAG TPA: HAD-IA family hydrolase [Pseudonocardiaceae bacterium]|nr:HAD-IA family hydrolase [Pseudonocardiaceae bacterium]